MSKTVSIEVREDLNRVRQGMLYVITTNEDPFVHPLLCAILKELMKDD